VVQALKPELALMEMVVPVMPMMILVVLSPRVVHVNLVHVLLIVKYLHGVVGVRVLNLVEMVLDLVLEL